MTSIAVVVATFGEPHWAELARARAVPSADAQGADEVHHVHGATLADARNDGVAASSSDWICHLDADDELEPGYLDAMRRAIAENGTGVIYAPALREVIDGVGGPARTLADRHIDSVNPCTIGTLIERALVLEVGGWWAERAWEDWSLFRRAWLAGALICHVPEAVYRAHVRYDGRNRTIENPAALHLQIRRAHQRWARQRRTQRVRTRA